jgi:hypothetical protein
MNSVAVRRKKGIKMKHQKFMFNKTARNFPNIGILLLCSLAMLIGFYLPAYGQTIGELSTSMAVQEKLMEQSGQTAAKLLANEPNAAIDANKPTVGSTAGVKPNEYSAGETQATSNKAIAGEPPKIPVETQMVETNIPDINDFNAFQRELVRINAETRNEEGQWTGRLERKADLARSIDELVTAQLRFIKKIAETEHAEQTVKAIDLVLKQRQDRLDKLVTKLDDELKQERQQQVERRRTPRTGGQEQTTRERPQRRPRETTINTTEGQQN